jgi:hypothetical protein
VISGYRFPLPVNKFRVPRVQQDLMVVSAHRRNPRRINDYRRDVERLPMTLRKLTNGQKADRPGRGRLQQHRDMRPFRRRLANGYRDTVEQAGDLRRRSGTWRLPPLFAIDHFLTLRSTALDAHSVTLPGCDHRSSRP